MRRLGGPRTLAAAFVGVATLAACTSTIGLDEERTDPRSLSVQAVTLATGLDRPVFLTSPVADSRLFVVEQPGTIRILRGSDVSADPFLDLRDRVSSGGERGLLGLAFDPDFRANGRFFVSYTDVDGNSVVSSFHDVDRSDRANPTTERIFLTVEQPFANHNGGHIAFGPDGMLYVGLGDGGSGGDPRGNGQDRSTLLGSILRIDVRGRLDPPYGVPADNPFVDVPGVRPEIWHYGLRNPWRFSFDTDAGRLFIGDVGQNRWEEIDAVDADEGGHNFGWNTMEGPECFNSVPCEADGLTLPVAVYRHDDGCSVTGGYMYRGNRTPGLEGRYVYADYCEGWVRSFRMSGSTATDPVELPLPSLGSITSFGEDAQGELYVLTQEGTVFALVAGG